jgi:hypothetical protein
LCAVCGLCVAAYPFVLMRPMRPDFLELGLPVVGLAMQLAACWLSWRRPVPAGFVCPRIDRLCASIAMPMSLLLSVPLAMFFLFVVLAVLADK